AGLDRISTGKILLENQEIQDWSEAQWADWRRVNVGFVFQDFRLIKSFTAYENVSLPLELLGWAPINIRTRTRALFTQLKLEQRLDHYPHQLSGGEQQRVAIARAFAHFPKLIFADEPTGNLDPETSESVFQELLHINAQEHTALIMVTHDMALAQRLQRQVPLAHGKVDAGTLDTARSTKEDTSS
ncbi:MAG: ATP-binding cassette domain-containing protein, partial [Myxococcota bacterium]